MKTILKISGILLFAATALLAASCADHRNDNMEEFQTMVYFRNGGEQSLTLYRTGEDGFYRVPVCKSGRNLEGVANAVVMPFDEAQMASYNIKNETSYTLMPSNLFSFVDADRKALADQQKIQLSFDSDEAYELVYVSIKTVALSALMEANPDNEYVLGLQVFSDQNVSEGINYIILSPDIEIPMISLVSPGVEVHKYTSDSQMEETYTNTVSLNMDENLWDFDITIAAKDAAWLTEYNNANNKAFELLPANCYTIPVTTLHFAKGTLEVPFSVTVNRGNMDMMKEYALPVQVTACSKSEFSIKEDAKNFILNVRLDPDQITLTADMVEVSANQSGDGTGAPALVDGDRDTYWHSPWSGSITNADPVYGVYVDITLKTPLKAITFNYCTRTQNANGVPTHVVVGVSNDKTSWTVLDGGDVATEEMASAVGGQWISLPVMKHTSTFKYIRFGVAESVAGDLRVNYASSPKWTALSELQLFGTAN